MLYKDIFLYSTVAMPPFFTPEDHDQAVAAMLAHPARDDRHLRALMNGIKRRARARAVIAFIQALRPAPPDATIATTRALMRALFGHAVSSNDLHRHFATPGRRANARADTAALAAWLAPQLETLQRAADSLRLELDAAWRVFTQTAADAAGDIRRADQRPVGSQPHES
ncbi:hypothetical protein [Burkholderia gladioli]|uniref:hypothetical protein n=1 Tax=Burkholderia gladioli TaxID=28095 RepID=UPI001FC8CEF9|nr:hypothetical protein [Burkholderia gladioli]